MSEKCDNEGCESETFNLEHVCTIDKYVEVYDLICSECGFVQWGSLKDIPINSFEEYKEGGTNER